VKKPLKRCAECGRKIRVHARQTECRRCARLTRKIANRADCALYYARTHIVIAPPHPYVTAGDVTLIFFAAARVPARPRYVNA
jgi:late competence protein required for DNA uptake (superfamily II DNA/RNA helicase)